MDPLFFSDQRKKIIKKKWTIKTIKKIVIDHNPDSSTPVDHESFHHYDLIDVDTIMIRKIQHFVAQKNPDIDFTFYMNCIDNMAIFTDQIHEKITDIELKFTTLHLHSSSSPPSMADTFLHHLTFFPLNVAQLLMFLYHLNSQFKFMVLYYLTFNDDDTSKPNKNFIRAMYFARKMNHFFYDVYNWILNQLMFKHVIDRKNVFEIDHDTIYHYFYKSFKEHWLDNNELLYNLFILDEIHLFKMPHDLNSSFVMKIPYHKLYKTKHAFLPKKKSSQYQTNLLHHLSSFKRLIEKCHDIYHDNPEMDNSSLFQFLAQNVDNHTLRLENAPCMEFKNIEKISYYYIFVDHHEETISSFHHLCFSDPHFFNYLPNQKILLFDTKHFMLKI